MKTLTTAKRICLLMGTLFALAGASSVFANAGDTIGNIATINYSVGGVAQPVIESSPTGNTTSGVGNGTSTAFIEDRLVNFTVTTVDAALISVAPGSTAQVTTFSVSNVGAGGFGVQSNGAVDFRLTALNRAAATVDPFGGAVNDSFDLTALQVFVEDGTTAGYQPAEDTETFIDELAPGSTATVYIIGNVPAAQANGTVAVVSLVATAAESLDAIDGTGVLDTGNLGADLVANAGADNAGQIDNVFIDAAGDIAADNASADNANDGFHSDSSGYIVSTALLSVAKTSGVIRDPVNAGTNPKAIPGGYVQYSISIQNSDSASADAVLTTITDVLSGDVAMDADHIVGATGLPQSAAGSGFRVQTGTSGCTGGNGANPRGIDQFFTTTNGDADGTAHDGSPTGGTVSVNLQTVLPADANHAAGELEPCENVTVTFNVIVQ